uniref:Interferon-induced protein with tetratricopeptide repeats 1-like n=1 Tax=Neogobius melanostomus TaxID=47308 RepID=A0A8C6TDY7_9GOBI
MSAHKHDPTGAGHLDGLQCHFTWELEHSRELLFSIRDRLEDLLPNESNPWKGYIYNLLGFLQTRLGRSDEALSLFSAASEALRGPALLVNYSDLAWLHHERGEPTLSQEYLQRMQELSKEYPTERDQLLPEVYAEKAWTQTEFCRNYTLAAWLFQKALEAEERVEWRSAQVLASFYVKKKKGSEFLEQLRHASERDPENLPLRAGYLQQCTRSGQEVGPEAKVLAAKVLQGPDRMHRHMESLLHLYRSAVSVHAAVDLATKALDKRPDSRFLKACLAMCHKWRIHQRAAVSQELIERTVALLHEVITLYPDSCFRTEIDLANAYAKSNHGLADAKLLYSELLRRDLEPRSKQILYNSYAKFLHFELNDSHMSTQYHLRAAEIPVKSYYRSNSIETLQKIKDRGVSDLELRERHSFFE